MQLSIIFLHQVTSLSQSDSDSMTFENFKVRNPEVKSGKPFFHRENGGQGTLGWYIPLIINPIYTLYHVGIYRYIPYDFTSLEIR